MWFQSSFVAACTLIAFSFQTLTELSKRFAVTQRDIKFTFSLDMVKKLSHVAVTLVPKHIQSSIISESFAFFFPLHTRRDEDLIALSNDSCWSFDPASPATVRNCVAALLSIIYASDVNYLIITSRRHAHPRPRPVCALEYETCCFRLFIESGSTPSDENH